MGKITWCLYQLNSGASFVDELWSVQYVSKHLMCCVVCTQKNIKQGLLFEVPTAGQKVFLLTSASTKYKWTYIVMSFQETRNHSLQTLHHINLICFN